jgi:hypothetical protein
VSCSVSSASVIKQPFGGSNYIPGFPSARGRFLAESGGGKKHRDIIVSAPIKTRKIRRKGRNQAGLWRENLHQLLACGDTQFRSIKNKRLVKKCASMVLSNNRLS